MIQTIREVQTAKHRQIILKIIIVRKQKAITVEIIMIREIQEIREAMKQKQIMKITKTDNKEVKING